MAELKNMGVKVKEPKMGVATAFEDESEEREVYPSLRFNGKEAAIIDLSQCKYGEEYEMTIHVKCTSIGGANYPGSGNSEDEPSVEFDVIAASEPAEIENEAEDADEEEEEPKRKPKQRVVGPEEMGLDKEY